MAPLLLACWSPHDSLCLYCPALCHSAMQLLLSCQLVPLSSQISIRLDTTHICAQRFEVEAALPRPIPSISLPPSPNEPLLSYLPRPLQLLLIFRVARHLRAAQRRKKMGLWAFLHFIFNLPHMAIAFTFLILISFIFSLCKVEVNLFNLFLHFPIFVIGLINMWAHFKGSHLYLHCKPLKILLRAHPTIFRNFTPTSNHKIKPILQFGLPFLANRFICIYCSDKRGIYKRKNTLRERQSPKP